MKEKNCKTPKRKRILYPGFHANLLNLFYDNIVRTLDSLYIPKSYVVTSGTPWMRFPSRGSPGPYKQGIEDEHTLNNRGESDMVFYLSRKFPPPSQAPALQS